MPRARAHPCSHTGTTGGTHQTLVKVPSPTPATGVASRHGNVTKKREMHTGGALSCVYTRNVPETNYTSRKGGRKRGCVSWGALLSCGLHVCSHLVPQTPPPPPRLLGVLPAGGCFTGLLTAQCPHQAPHMTARPGQGCLMDHPGPLPHRPSHSRPRTAPPILSVTPRAFVPLPPRVVSDPPPNGAHSAARAQAGTRPRRLDPPELWVQQGQCCFLGM